MVKRERESNLLNIKYCESFTDREIEIHLFILKDKSYELAIEENSAKCKTIKVKEEGFGEILNTLLSLNLKKIASDNILGLDGSSLKIDFGGIIPQCQISLWGINYNTEERGLQELLDIILKIFDLCDIQDTFIQKGL